MSQPQQTPSASFSEYLSNGKNLAETIIALSAAGTVAVASIVQDRPSVPMECVSGKVEVIPAKNGSNMLYFKDANRLVIMPSDIIGAKTGDYVSVVARQQGNALYGEGYLSSCHGDAPNPR